MYVRKIDDKELTFHVSGMLYQRSLIMRDIETGTYWSHILGRGMQGPLHQRKLKVLPSTLTDWKTWRDSHPDTTVMVMSNTRMEFTRASYKNKTRYGAGAIVNDKPKIWSFWGLDRQPLVNDVLENQSLVIWYDQSSSGVWGWQRNVNGDVLEFERKDDKIIDKKTNSVWDLKLGKSIEGPLAGTTLKPFILIPTFQRAWRTFHKDTAIWPKDDPYKLADDPITAGGVVVE